MPPDSQCSITIINITIILVSSQSWYEVPCTITLVVWVSDWVKLHNSYPKSISITIYILQILKCSCVARSLIPSLIMNSILSYFVSIIWFRKLSLQHSSLLSCDCLSYLLLDGHQSQIITEIHTWCIYIVLWFCIWSWSYVECPCSHLTTKTWI